MQDLFVFGQRFHPIDGFRGNNQQSAVLHILPEFTQL